MLHYATVLIPMPSCSYWFPMAQRWASQSSLALWLTQKTRPYLTRNALAGGRKLQTCFNKEVPCPHGYHLPLYPPHVLYDELRQQS